jgi:hypothetical protein
MIHQLWVCGDGQVTKYKGDVQAYKVLGSNCAQDHSNSHFTEFDCQQLEAKAMSVEIMEFSSTFKMPMTGLISVYSSNDKSFLNHFVAKSYKMNLDSCICVNRSLPGTGLRISPTKPNPAPSGHLLLVTSLSGRICRSFSMRCTTHESSLISVKCFPRIATECVSTSSDLQHSVDLASE